MLIPSDAGNGLNLAKTFSRRFEKLGQMSLLLKEPNRGTILTLCRLRVSSARGSNMIELFSCNALSGSITSIILYCISLSELSGKVRSESSVRD